MTPATSGGGTRKHLVSQSSVLSQPDLLSPEELFSQYTLVITKSDIWKVIIINWSEPGKKTDLVGDENVSSSLQKIMTVTIIQVFLLISLLTLQNKRDPEEFQKDSAWYRK